MSAFCESCEAPAELELVDGTHWCIACDVAARELGYDNMQVRYLLDEEN